MPTATASPTSTPEPTAIPTLSPTATPAPTVSLIQTDAPYDGVWLGTTDQGDEIAFEIENGALRSISVGFTILGCEADSPMGAYFGSPEYFVEDGSLSLTLAGLYLIDVEATFTSTSSATGTLDIADSNPCGQGLNTSWIAVPLELYEPPPLSPEVLARIPDFAIPDNLFRKEYGDLEFDDFTKVLGSKGNWFLIQSTPESVLPIPSGWATTETGQDAYYIIFDIHDSEVPLIRIRLGSEGFEGDSRSSTEVISEFEGLVAEISTMKIL
ncbi:MAG: hypothetical protein IH861_08595, partial [Chloroflexi bacterium]|nr:hypothetical protein [Chloroflexota bacterium]